MKGSIVLAKRTATRKALAVMGGLALALAALTAAAPQAQAQQFGIGVQFGGPRYLAPAPVYGTYGYAPGYLAPRYGYASGYWGERRAEEWRANQSREHAFREHEAWGHRGGYYGRGYGR